MEVPLLGQEDSTVNRSETHVPEISNCALEERHYSPEREITQFSDLETLGIKNDEPTVCEKFVEVIMDNFQLSRMRLE